MDKIDKNEKIGQKRTKKDKMDKKGQNYQNWTKMDKKGQKGQNWQKVYKFKNMITIFLVKKYLAKNI